MTDREQIYHEINYLLALAEEDISRYGKRSNLRWEIGIGIKAIMCQDLIKRCSFIDEDEKEVTLLMGYPVTFNYQEPNIIRLWKQIEKD